MPCRLRSPLIALLLAAPGLADPAGPPVPIPAKTTPAQQAIALSHQRNDTPPQAKPCRQARGQDEITVCGNPGDRSPYRIPLPDERVGQRHLGELPNVDIGTEPVPVVPETTVARFGMSKAAKERNATLKVIDAQAQEKMAQAERAKRAGTEAEGAGIVRLKLDPDAEDQPE